MSEQETYLKSIPIGATKTQKVIVQRESSAIVLTSTSCLSDSSLLLPFSSLSRIEVRKLRETSRATKITIKSGTAHCCDSVG